MSRSSEGQCLNLDLSNHVCEYEINRLTNEKGISGNQNSNTSC